LPGGYVRCMGNQNLVRLARARDLARSGLARDVRLAAHVSLAELAAPVGVNISTLSRWERGLAQPTGRAALRCWS